MTDCWILVPDTDHLAAHGVAYDLVPIPFDGMDHVRWHRTDAIDVASVAFRGNVAACRDTELPVTQPPWPVMSRRVYDVLRETGPMPRHRFVPSPAEAVPGGERRDDLGILHLHEHADQLDRARSRFTTDPSDPDRIEYVDELVLLPFRDVPCPAVFRLSAFPEPLLVSDRARRALVAAGVRGCEYWEPRRWM